MCAHLADPVPTHHLLETMLLHVFAPPPRPCLQAELLESLVESLLADPFLSRLRNLELQPEVAMPAAPPAPPAPTVAPLSSLGPEALQPEVPPPPQKPQPATSPRASKLSVLVDVPMLSVLMYADLLPSDALPTVYTSQHRWVAACWARRCMEPGAGLMLLVAHYKLKSVLPAPKLPPPQNCPYGNQYEVLTFSHTIT